MHLVIFCDGGARGNPGPAATGVVIKDELGNIIHAFGEWLGIATNNQAEYQAVSQALSWVSSQKHSFPTLTKLNFFLDSELLVKQLTGKYKIKNFQLAILAQEIHSLIRKLGLEISFTHIPRRLNKEADSMVNRALDSHFR